MSYGPIKVFNATVTSGASTGTADLSKSWSNVRLQYSSMSTQATIAVYGSFDGTTYMPSLERVPNTTSVQWQAVEIATAISQGIFPLDIAYQYLQLRLGAVVSGGVAFKVICTD